jgi:hypothetical protein
MKHTLTKIILKGKSTENKKLIRSLHRTYSQLHYFDKIYLCEEKEGVLILENDSVTILLTLIDSKSFNVSFIDPFDWEDGIVKELACKVLKENELLDFLEKKEHPMFLYKKHLIETMNNYGLDTEFDFVNTKEELTLSIEDIICMMKDSYVKGLRNIKK